MNRTFIVLQKTAFIHKNNQTPCKGSKTNLCNKVILCMDLFPAANGLSIFVAYNSRHSSKATKCKQNFVPDTNGPEVAIKISKFQVITQS